MNTMPSLQERESALFALALEKPDAERAAFLDAVCGGNSALRRRLEALLAAHDEPESALSDDAKLTAQGTMKLGFAEEPADEAVGQVLGRYKLLEKVGEGGCGVVYVAEQTEPVRRRVALKVIKLGMDTKAVVARFEAERQALALMDHPNIARVLDAGSTEMGRPYFVMELVRGIRITDYCDQNHLTTKERLDLFVKICQAIQHAHQKGIIHRDIKPSNILVTLHDGVPVPKVIDFGIAKATEGRLTDATVYTQLHQFIGTPAYMSPEQAEMSGLDVDTRSDLYSLGVLLYELLTGKTPFDATELMAAGIDAMRKTIREKDPIRPSTRLATLEGEERTATAKRHAVEIPRLVHQLKGDLDWIVMKCLEKDRTRRYETANGLAADLRRHLQNEPVLACPPSTSYRVQKAWRRNQLAFSAAIAVLAALILGVVASTWQAIRATRSERQQALLRAEAVAAKSLAEKAQLDEQRQREQAQAAELLAHRTAYSSDMNLVQQSLGLNNLGRAQAILTRNRPGDSASSGKSQRDLRDWEWRYLWGQARPDEHEVLWTEPERLHSMSIDFAGEKLAMGTADSAVVVIDVKSHAVLFRSENAHEPVFAHHSALLAYYEDPSSPTNQGSIVLRDFAQGLEVRRLRCPRNSRITNLGFGPDDQTLFIARVAYSPSQLLVSRWDLRTETSLWEKKIDRPRMAVGRTVAIAPDGSAFAKALQNGRFQIIEGRDGSERLTINATQDSVTALTFSLDGNLIISGHGFIDPVIRIWDAHTGAALGSLEGHRSWVSDLVFTPDGSLLLSASGDQTIRIWKWPSRTPEGVLRGHLSEVAALAIAADSQRLISSCKDGSIYIWKLDVPKARPPYQILPHPVDFAVFTPESKSILAVGRDQSLALWDSRTITEKRRFFSANPAQRSVNISSDGTRAVLAEDDGVVRIRHLQSDSEITARWPVTNAIGTMFTDNGSYLLAASNSDNRSDPVTFLVMESATGRYVGSFRTQRPGLRPMTPGVANLLAIPSGNDLRLWDLSQLETPPRVIHELGYVSGFAVSPEAHIAACSSESGSIGLYEFPSLHRTETLRGFLLGVHSVTFSPDGNRLAAGSSGQEAVKLWDVQTRQEVITLAAEGSLFRYITFSRDGNSLMAINSSGACHIWTAPSWKEIASVENTEKEVR